MQQTYRQYNHRNTLLGKQPRLNNAACNKKDKEINHTGIGIDGRAIQAIANTKNADTTVFVKTDQATNLTKEQLRKQEKEAKYQQKQA